MARTPSSMNLSEAAQAPTGSHEESHLNRYAFRIAIAAAIGGFLFGYDISIISGALIFLKSEFALDQHQEGFAVSSAALGCIIGPLVAAALSDKIGRRGTLAVSALLLFLASLGTAIPKDMITFNAFRILGGIGVGLASIVTPMYIAEMAPARLRGRLVSVNQLAIVIGLFSAIVVSYALSFRGDWRWMFGSECLPALAWLGLLFALPESPRWLMEKGREAEALALLIKSEGPVKSHVALAEIKDSMREEVGNWSELFQPGTRTALLVAVMLAIFQQATGVSILLVYAPTIFKSAGFDLPSDAIAQAIPLGVWNIICTALAFWLVDRWGRRPLLLAGTAAMAVGLVVMGLCFHYQVTGYAVVVMMFLCVGAYVSSLAPLAWLIMSEIFPTRVRGRAMSIAGICLWIAFFVGSQVFPLLSHSFEREFGSPAGVFWLFSGVCLLALGFCWRLVPETKGRTLEEIAGAWK
ncbi:MAG TPA: sugar porter family MFS transporter [Gemmataceae bacterium]|nr:sugar porter family MFS transporter [Gemmataceae bacterium]